MDVSKLITALLSGMKEISVSETVVGAPIRSGNSTIIPVNKVTLGFGTGAEMMPASSSRAPIATAAWMNVSTIST